MHGLRRVVRQDDARGNRRHWAAYKPPSAGRQLMASDALSFIQVDRDVSHKAALLAATWRLPFPMALGGLVAFWQSCTDADELRHLVETGKTSLVLDNNSIVRRFQTLGIDINPQHLADYGFLEPAEGGWRVRGISRYLESIRKSIQAQAAGQIGGKRSSSLKRNSSETTENGNSACDSLERNSTNIKKYKERINIQKYEEIPKYLKEGTKSAVPSSPEGKKPSNLSVEITQNTQAEGRFRPLQKVLCDEFERVFSRKYKWQKAKDSQALVSLIAHETDESISKLWSLGISLERWPSVRTISQLNSRWNDLSAWNPLKRPSSDFRKSPVRAEEMSPLLEEVRNANEEF